mmetsp:Transcript_11270/g.20348  ORF Transcript_11270/g.20348 Transcript_11270/m.20348 type:complete len:278 (+) Transcript_11270:779-1612(+)
MCAQLAHLVRHEPNVAHADGVPLRLDLTRPASRRLCSTGRIQSVPALHGRRVLRHVVPVVLIPGRHKIGVVHHLGADGAESTSDHSHLLRAPLQRRPRRLYRKRTHAVDHHPLARPAVHTGRGVTNSRHNLDSGRNVERGVSRDKLPRHSHAIVDGEHDAARTQASWSAGRTRNMDDVAAVRLASNVGDSHAKTEPVRPKTATQSSQVLEHLLGRTVVAVRGAARQHLLHAVATLAAVHLAGGVGIEAPHATRHPATLQHCHVHPLVGELVAGVHSQ